MERNFTCRPSQKLRPAPLASRPSNPSPMLTLFSSPSLAINLLLPLSLSLSDDSGRNLPPPSCFYDKESSLISPSLPLCLSVSFLLFLFFDHSPYLATAPKTAHMFRASATRETIEYGKEYAHMVFIKVSTVEEPPLFRRKCWSQCLHGFMLTDANLPHGMWNRSLLVVPSKSFPLIHNTACNDDVSSPFATAELVSCIAM